MAVAAPSQPPLPNTSTTAQFYSYHLGSFEPLTMQVQMLEGGCVTRSLYFCQNDPNGMPLRLQDENGVIAWEAYYSAFGKIQDLATDQINQPLRLQGQYCDDESGLHYNRFRYYDAGAGCFISSDPIGLAGGANPYRFAANVFRWIDPQGLQRIFDPAPYHPEGRDTAIKSRGPTNGQAALDESIQIKPTSPRRIAVDAEAGEIVILDRTRVLPDKVEGGVKIPGDEIYHGHVRKWDDLDEKQKSILKKSGKVDSKGRIKCIPGSEE
jgi:RHS repeat-associated protein